MAEEKEKQNEAKYRPSEIEPRWQQYWLEHKTFRAEVDYSRPKFYILDMFPYPSAAGLHVGHPEGYTATDILARYKRMRGFNVLHPMGWDAFGLPAEQYALQTGTHPAITTRQNIDTFRRQIQSFGFSYDWDREISTCDADYYRWTQWIFMQLFKKGLAYMDDVPVNWCPALGTVLANEEVIDGKSERGGHDVVRMPMRQWMLKITDYADRLLDSLKDLDWPEGIIEMQRNWIGRSEGATFRFEVFGHTGTTFDVFTTRPDTLFGATYAVLAPEHRIVEQITTAEQAVQVSAYVTEAKQKLDRLRMEEAEKKSGVFTGAYAINPTNGRHIPIFVADYVLVSYGTGAIMAVPAHDQRDWEFAKKYGLEIVEVVSGGDISEGAHEGDGVLVNSGFLNGLSVPEAKKRIIDWLEAEGIGRRSISYKLRDWLFSRQRYWGEPFPVIHTDQGPKLIGEAELPLVLPEVERYQPTSDGQPPLARATEWLTTTDPATGKPAQRETNTMPQWAGSCWYYLRYLDAKNNNKIFDEEAERYWMPVDIYVGGAEHAVLHLLYARFWHHVLYDLGVVSTAEPFKKLINQGMILGEDNQKMSKSRGNVINPDELIGQYGADTVRMYEMFMGPLEQVKAWNTQSVNGIYKFLNRAWNLIIDQQGGVQSSIVADSSVITGELAVERALHRTIVKVTEDIENFKFHTAIAALMTFVNEAADAQSIPKRVIESFLLLLAPFAPHIAEELWQKLGHDHTLSYEPWPVADPALAKLDVLTVAVQVNGKLRDTIEVSAEAPDDEVLAIAKNSARVQTYLEGKRIVREIVVPKRLVNLVVQ